MLERIERVKAKERQKAGVDLKENFPEGGQTRDKVAEKRLIDDLAERSKRHYTPLEHIQEQGQRKTGQKRESEGHTSYIHQ